MVIKVKKFIKSVLLIAISAVMLIGCSTSKATDDKGNEDNNNNNNEVVIWSYYNDFDAIISKFNEKYPDIKVKVESFTYDSYLDKFLDALITGEVPDLMIIDSTHYGQFNSIEGLQDLKELGVEKYQNDFDKELWDLGLSINGKEMLGIPFASAPRLTYYRADIMEKYGFPSDPQELGTYMENPENWLNIARTLKKDNINIIQWAADPVTFTAAGYGSFDRELNYVKSNDAFKTAIDVARQGREESLPSYIDLWSETGQKALRDGEFAMLYLGSWGAKEIENWVPDQAGKWRATRLPLNIYGWNNSTIMSMTKQSKNKEDAYKFLEFFCFEYASETSLGSVSGYLPLRNNPKAIEYENPFLGNQKEQALYEDIMAKTNEYPVTALDEEAFKIWEECVNNGLSENSSTDEIINNIDAQVKTKLGKKKEILLESMK